MRANAEVLPRLPQVAALTVQDAEQVRGGGVDRPPLPPLIDWINPPVPPIVLPSTGPTFPW